MTENIISYIVNGKEQVKDLSGPIKQLVGLCKQFDGMTEADSKACIQQVQSKCPGELIEFYNALHEYI